MTGPEHYREAERLSDKAMAAVGEGVPEFYVAAAQVHATLAVAAATIQAEIGDLNATWGKTIRGAA